jgi:hypothetical protein
MSGFMSLGAAMSERKRGRASTGKDTKGAGKLARTHLVALTLSLSTTRHTTRAEITSTPCGAHLRS